MKRLIRSSRNIQERYVKSPMDTIKSKLGISWGSNTDVRQINDGKWNFVVSDRYNKLLSSDEIYKRIKELGGKYITVRYGNIYFYLDISKLEDEYQKAKAAAKEEYQSKLDAFDVSEYAPSAKILDKLMDYRNRGSKVNVKSIKDPAKLLTYYYGAKLLGWSDLAYDIRNVMGIDYDDEINAIDRQVKPDDQFADTRDSDDIALGFSDSKGLFIFDQRSSKGKPSCWIPKKVLDYFVQHDIPVHFGKRTSGSRWDRNGREWSEVEHLTFFPGTDDEFDYEIVVHTDEGGAPNTYTSGDTEERVSAQKLLEGIDRRLKREGLI